MGHTSRRSVCSGFARRFLARRSRYRLSYAPSLACGGGLGWGRPPLPVPTTAYILLVSIHWLRRMKTAKIFQHGNSQAVRLPKEFRFEENEVVIKRHGGGVLLLPKRYAVDDLLKILQDFEGPIERGENPPPQARKF